MFASTPEAKSIGWSYRSANEIRQIADSDGSVLVVPVGSVEQHGVHLPVATDSLLAEAVATGAAERASEDVPVLVAPTVWSGYSPHHRSLGGTLTTGFSTLLEFLRGTLETAVDDGFDALLLVNGHGGNRSLVGALTSELGRRDPSRQFLSLTYFDVVDDLVDEVRDSDPGGMAHGGEFETSLMMHLHEDLVDEAAVAERLDEPYSLGDRDLVEPGPLSVYRPFEYYSDSGAIGDPGEASASKGETLYQGIVKELGDLVVEISRRAEPEPER